MFYWVLDDSETNNLVFFFVLNNAEKSYSNSVHQLI